MLEIGAELIDGLLGDARIHGEPGALGRAARFFAVARRAPRGERRLRDQRRCEEKNEEKDYDHDGMPKRTISKRSSRAQSLPDCESNDTIISITKIITNHLVSLLRERVPRNFEAQLPISTSADISEKLCLFIKYYWLLDKKIVCKQRL